MATIIFPAVGMGLIEWPWLPASLHVLYTAQDELWVRLSDLCQAFLLNDSCLYRPTRLSPYLRVMALVWGTHLQDPTWYVREDALLSWLATLNPPDVALSLRVIVDGLRYTPPPLPSNRLIRTSAGSALRRAELVIRQIMIAHAE